MYHVSTQGVDEHLINVHYYYYYCEKVNFTETQLCRIKRKSIKYQ